MKNYKKYYPYVLIIIGIYLLYKFTDYKKIADTNSVPTTVNGYFLYLFKNQINV